MNFKHALHYVKPEIYTKTRVVSHWTGLLYYTFVMFTKRERFGVSPGSL